MTDHDEHQQMVTDCENRESKLTTDWERSFIDSISRQLADGHRLSEKQAERLDAIWERCDMTFDDDYPAARVRWRHSARDMPPGRRQWPPPQRLDFGGFTMVQSRRSEITDEQRQVDPRLPGRGVLPREGRLMCMRCAGGVHVWRLPLASGGRVFMEFHRYFGPSFFRDRACRRRSSSGTRARRSAPRWTGSLTAGRWPDMPIKPENKARYPANWKLIREDILRRALWRCEWPGCGALHRDVGWWRDDGKFIHMGRALRDAGAKAGDRIACAGGGEIAADDRADHRPPGSSAGEL